VVREVELAALATTHTHAGGDSDSSENTDGQTDDGYTTSDLECLAFAVQCTLRPRRCSHSRS